ncbi:MAG: ribonuclease III [Clostridia bacterium]|nr:ribonuclease III [Clostridia bacterium]
MNGQNELPSVEALAFLGDAVHSLYIRAHLVRRGIPRSGELNRQTQTYITATAQARLAEKCKPYFTELEADVFRRGANHKHLQTPKHTSGADYRAATGLECVLGMHYYLGNYERIDALLSMEGQNDDTED